MRKIDQLNDAHCLMPDALAEQMPAFNQQAPHEGDHLKRGATYYDVRRQGDVIAFVKIFNPVGSWTWYLTEWNPAERMAFGLVCGDFDEWGDIWLQELEEITLSVNLNGVKIPDILKLERDLHFRPTRIREH